MNWNHDFYDREDGLKHCKVCNGAEGTLPTDCPGRPLTESEADRIYLAGNLDFQEGTWIQILGVNPALPL